MNTLRRTCAATILSLSLAMSVLAGQIEAPGVASPQPPPSSQTSSITTIILMVVSAVYR